MAGCHKPDSVADFLDRWKQETRRGLSAEDAESRAGDAISRIMSGIWGQKSATQLGDYYSKMIALTKSRLEHNRDLHRGPHSRLRNIKANGKRRSKSSRGHPGRSICV